MNVIFVDTHSREVMESPNGDLPEGWMIPPLDISREDCQEVPPHGVVLACSSEASYKEQLQAKLASAQ